MKEKIIRLFIAGIFLASSIACASSDRSLTIPDRDNAASGEITVMTYNVYCRLCPSLYKWKDRLEGFGTIFGQYKPDILAAQELICPGGDGRQVLNQLTTNVDKPDKFICAGSNCDSALYYRTDRFEKLDSGYFKLPRQYLFKRSVVWAYLKEGETGARFLVASTHLSNTGSRPESARRFVQGITKLQGGNLPLILMGDYNASLTGRSLKRTKEQTDDDIKSRKGAYEVLQRNYVNALDLTAQCKGAFSRPPKPEDAVPHPGGFATNELIDHIFLKTPPRWTWEVSEWTTHYKWNGKRNPSDHWPVIAKLRLKPGARIAPGRVPLRHCRLQWPMTSGPDPADCVCRR